jgi:hypothetical protein
MTESAEHPNVARGTKLYGTMVMGDEEAFGQLVTADAQIHWPGAGRHTLGGTYSGREEVMAAIARCRELTEGTLAGEILDILADDHHVVIVNRVTGHRKGMDLDIIYAGCFIFDDDGKAQELWWLPNDIQQEVDFLS